MVTDLMTWKITKDELTERMAVVSPRANAVEGPTPQPPPEPGRAEPISGFVYSGQWRDGYEAQDRMLNEFEKEEELHNMIIERFENSKPQGSRQKLSEEMKEQLRSLGYIAY